MVKIYTHTNFLTEQNRRFIFPLLLDLWYLKNEDLLNSYQFEENPENADVFVLPLNYNYLMKSESNFVKAFKAQANKLKKKLWIYTSGDYGYTIRDISIVTFRLGGFHNRMPKNTIILPSFITDPYTMDNLKGFDSLPWTEKPSIGFVGHAHLSVFKFAKELINYLRHTLKVILKKKLDDYQGFYPSSIIRGFILKRIEKNDNFNSNFIKRKKYRAGANSQEKLQETTDQFFKNIYDNAYTVCIRGLGNFSVRFYEALAVGRIPILINTNCRLPLNEYIDWKKHCVIVNDVNNLEKIIEAFHKRHDESSFKELQQSNRKLWLNLLKRESFFKTLTESIN
jgi:hypothetical protein